MATLITETKWHGNPRPILSYATTVFKEAVASPYYKDGRDVPTYGHYVTPVPLEDLAPAATAGEAGPDVLVDFKMDGLWTAPTGLQILLTLVGSDNVSTQIDFSTDLIGPVEAAEQVAATLNIIGAGDILCVNEGQTVVISAINTTTAITITTLTVV